MIITTTNSVENKTIKSYEGIVFGEVISGINMLKDMGAGLRNIFGGRSQGYENELLNARTEALKDMEERAKTMGADAVIVARPFVNAIYGAKEEGIQVLVDKLGSELQDTMEMCGAKSLKDITRDMVR